MYAMHEYEILRQHTERIKNAEASYFHQSAAQSAHPHNRRVHFLQRKIAGLLIACGRSLLRKGEQMRYSVAG
jgi:hypothetical protein